MPALSVGNTFTVSTLEDGTSPWFADIENEMDSVACDNEGHPIAAYNRTFAVKMWHGSEQVALTAITIGTTPTGITATGNASAKTITISVATTATIAQVNEVSFTLSADGTTPMPLHFILNGVRPGANGDPAVIWRLVPSHSEIIKQKDGSTWPKGNIVCTVTKTIGNTTTPVTTGFTLMMNLDGTGEVAYADTAASSVTTSLEYILYVGGEVVDRESIPVVSDGTNGADASLYKLLPSPTVINLSRTADGGYIPTTSSLTCGYTKTVGTTTTSSAAPTAGIDSRFIYFRRRVRATGQMETYFVRYTGGTTSYYTHARALLTTLDVVKYDLVSLFFSTQTTTTKYTVDGVQIYGRTTLTYFDTIDVPITENGLPGLPGDSPWFADLSNEIDSIACDSSGKPVAAQTVTSKVFLYHGSTEAEFTINPVGVFLNDNQMSFDGSNTWTDASTPTRTMTFDSSNDTITVAYTTSAVISSTNHKDVFTITLWNETENVYAYVSLTVNGIFGDARYNLVPSASVISRNSAGTTYNPATLTCTYTKYDVSKGAFVSASGATIKYVKDNDSEVNAITYSTALTPGTTFTDKVTFLLYVGTTIVDRETVVIVKDGATGPKGDQGDPGGTGPKGDDGDNAQYIFLQGSARENASGGSTSKPRIVRINGVDKVSEYGSIGLKLVIIERSTLNVKKVNGVDQIFWYDTYNDARPNGTISQGAGSISDLVTKLNSLDNTVFIALTSFDAIGWIPSSSPSIPTLISTLQGFGMGTLPYTDYGRYPFVFLGYLGLESGYGLMQMHNLGSSDHVATVGAYIVDGTFQSSKDGNDGADAVFYEIRTVTNNLSVQPNGKYAGNLTWEVVKHEGASTSDMSTGTFRWRLLGNGWQEDYRQGTSCSILSGNAWSSFPSSSGMNCAVSIQLSYVDTSSVEQATVTVHINIEGQMSRNLYYAGEWASGLSFEVTDYKAPYYSWTQGGLTKYWAFVGANGTYTSSSAGTPGSSDNWREMNNEFQYLITKAFFSDFAKLGSAVFNGDYMFSQYGYMLGYCNCRTDIENANWYERVNPNDVFGNSWNDNSGSVFDMTGTDTNSFNNSTASNWIDFYSQVYGEADYITLTTGKYYSIRVCGSGHYDWKLANGLSSSAHVVAEGKIDYVSNNNIYWHSDSAVNFLCSYSGNYYLYVKTSSSQSCEVSEVYVNPCQFVPRIAFNWRNGEGAFDKIRIRGGFLRGTTTLTPTNVSSYYSGTSISFNKIGGNIVFSSAFTTVQALSFGIHSESEKDYAMGFAGQEFVIVNKTSKDVHLLGGFYYYYSDGTYPNQLRQILPAGKTAIVNCDCRLAETRSGSTVTYGALEVFWRLRIEGNSESI